MSLIQDVQRLCARLAPLGWGDLLAAHGLDLASRQLPRELNRPLRKIDRTIPGFEDFSLEGVRGIEPGAPARSLLYHALASPAVTGGRGGRLRGFATLAELDLLENYIFAARRATIASLAALAGGEPLSVVVFAHEYRIASRTPHRRHADMVFSRTGVSRVGTAPARYDARLRGFSPAVSGKPHAIRVSPARYSAFLAVRLKGNQAAARPMRYQAAQAHTHSVADNRRSFWVPIHKLWSGPECVTDVPGLTVRLSASHVNEKLRRIHLKLAQRTVGGKPFKSGWVEPQISTPPFRFSGGIAQLRPQESDPPGLLVPVPHPTLVEPATYRGKPLGFNVPSRDGFLASLDLNAEYNDQGEEIRSAPAYVHARTRMTADGEVDLNQFPDAARLVDKGGYVARHYVDYTGDGWVKARIVKGSLGKAVGGPLPAYSLVTAPDFLYSCDQGEVSNWSDALPEGIRHRIWYMAPMPLSDMRLPANLQLPNTPFRADDDTITAVVPMALPVSRGKPFGSTGAPHPVHTSLPDDAAGVMAPGWDVARDWLPDHRQHLAAYGLGSPFPEDSKLCAALSAFWPAVAPDATREFAYPEHQGYRTVTPLTDEEIGLGRGPAWDAVPGPRMVRKNGRLVVQYANIAHADYVLSAVAGRLSAELTGRISQAEFEARTLAMATAYRSLGHSHSRWVLFSYRQADPSDPERRRAERATGQALASPTAHRFEMFFPGDYTSLSKPPYLSELVVRRRAVLLVDPAAGVVLTARNGRWAGKRVSWK